jgi:hypothetical protein
MRPDFQVTGNNTEQQLPASNVSRAVIMLLAEMSADDLLSVRKTIDQRLQALGRAD